jgi:hypothetical protein
MKRRELIVGLVLAATDGRARVQSPCPRLPKGGDGEARRMKPRSWWPFLVA